MSFLLAELCPFCNERNMKLKFYLTVVLLAFIFPSFGQVFVTGDTVVDCSHPSATMNATLIGDRPINARITTDDVYSAVHPLGFNFRFYGTVYSRCLIGANGTIGFDTTLAGAYDPWPITSRLRGNSSKYNSICGPWCDIDITAGSRSGMISYSTDGTAPNRKYVVNYCTVNMFSCTSQTITTQIVLYESTNVIDVYVAHKVVCSTWNGGYAIIGVQNSDGTHATTAPSRDYPSVYTCLDEGWRFTPDTSDTVYAVASIPFTPIPYDTSTIYWYNASTGAFLGTGASLTVSPSVTTTYIAAALGCGDTSFAYHTVQRGPFVTPIHEVTHVDPSYCGASDGSITIGGFAASSRYVVYYDYNGTPMTPLGTSSDASGNITLTGLSARGGTGSYDNIHGIPTSSSLCPTDTIGPIILTNPAPPTVRVDSPLVLTCIGIPVQLNSYPSISGLPYSYLWTPGTALSGTTIPNPIVTPTAAGDVVYTITINPGTDPTCNSSTTLTVHTEAPFILNNHDTAICLGKHVNASITGSNNFAYTWTPTTGVSDPNIKEPVLTPTTTTYYSVVATYAHCPDMGAGFNIEVDTLAPYRRIIDTLCLGMADTLDLRVAGPDTGSNHYTYAWVPATNVNDPAAGNTWIRPTAPGIVNYQLLINPNARECTMTDDIMLYVLPNSISVSPIDTQICMGATINMVGSGHPLFHYQWLPTAGIAISDVLNASITPDTSARYTVIATYHLCPPMFAYSNISVQPNPVVSISENRFKCQFDTVHIKATVLPTWYNNYSYTWTPATDLDTTHGATVVFNGGTTTRLFVTVTTPAGCTAKDSVDVNVYPQNFASITPDHVDFCPHTSMDLVPTGPVGTTYHWYPHYYLSDSLGSSPKVEPISDQVYTVVATSSSGCKDTFNFTAKVFPAAVISIPDTITLHPGQTYQILTMSNCTSFTWFPDAGLDHNNVMDPVANPAASTVYFVTGTTQDGCVVTDSINIIVDGDSYVGAANAFTPGVEPNSKFKLVVDGIAELDHFRIFDRWGLMVFSTNDITEGWDGTYQGKAQPFGVYIYELVAKTSAGKVVTRRGNVTLLR